MFLKLKLRRAAASVPPKTITAACQSRKIMESLTELNATTKNTVMAKIKPTSELFKKPPAFKKYCRVKSENYAFGVKIKLIEVNMFQFGPIEGPAHGPVQSYYGVECAIY